MNEKFGRHIVTTQRLNAGDVIAVEQHFYKSLDKNDLNSRCANCLQENPKCAVPCEKCSSVVFCSEDCRGLAAEEFHEHECKSIHRRTKDDGFLLMLERSLFKVLSICGNLEKLEQLMRVNQSSMTVFDLDMNENPQELNLKLIFACHSLEAEVPSVEDFKFVNEFVDHHEVFKTVWKTDNERDFLINFILKFIGILSRNSFTLHWSSHADEIGCGIFPFASLINHSCSPNLFRACVNGSIAFVVRRPIEEDEQLFLCYQ